MKVEALLVALVAVVAVSARHHGHTSQSSQRASHAERLAQAARSQGQPELIVYLMQQDERRRSEDKHSDLNEVTQELGLTSGHRPRPFAGDLDILDYFRDVPYEHWSCCMLGKLSGDKGFSCISEHYATSVQFMRMRNRPGSRRRPNVRGYGHTLMGHFQRCFRAGQEKQEEFRTCCIAGAMQKIDLLRWEEHRALPLDDEIVPLDA